MAGIAEGTLFVYFPTKDVLFNALYLSLKREVIAMIMSGFPVKAGAKVQALHFWTCYVNWGVVNPDKRHAMARLNVSDRITEETRGQASRESAGCFDVLEVRLASGSLSGSSPAFVAAMMSSLAETTMAFMVEQPERAEVFLRSGFEAFWRATGK
jgi:AcrR family transcriptional regulator